MDEIISLKMKGIDGMRHLCYEIYSPVCHLYILSPEIISPEMGNTYLHADRTRVSLIIMMSIMLDIAIMATGDSPSDSRARTHMSRCLHVKFGAHTQPQGMSPRGADG